MSAADSPTSNRFRSSVMSLWVQRFSTMRYHSTARLDPAMFHPGDRHSVNRRSPAHQLGSEPKQA